MGHAASPLLSFTIGKPEIAEYLLQQGAKVNAQDAYGRTALWDAVWSNQPDMVKLLLDHLDRLAKFLLVF